METAIACPVQENPEKEWLEWAPVIPIPPEKS